jgi:hypothetical protein
MIFLARLLPYTPGPCQTEETVWECIFANNLDAIELNRFRDERLLRSLVITSLGTTTGAACFRGLAGRGWSTWLCTEN